MWPYIRPNWCGQEVRVISLYCRHSRRCGRVSKLGGVIEAVYRLLPSFFTIPDPGRRYQKVSTKSTVPSVSSRMLFGSVSLAVKILVRAGDGEQPLLRQDRRGSIYMFRQSERGDSREKNRRSEDLLERIYYSKQRPAHWRRSNSLSLGQCWWFGLLQVRADALVVCSFV